jgi:membrane protein
MKPFLHRLYRAVRRVIPNCVTQTQAVAFNMFLAFFPMLLLVMGAVSGSESFQQAFRGMMAGLKPVLPPGILTILNSIVSRSDLHRWRWVLLGLIGTLLAGAQMMKLLMEGFRMVYQDRDREDFLGRHLRALLLLSVTLVPSVLTVNLIVFGRQVRGWMLHVSLMPVFTRLVWSAAYVAASLVIAMAVLSIVYRVGRPGSQRWASVVPGAAIATALWWVVSISLGTYLRHAPYSTVYGGLTVAIGLMIWMQLTATILLIGAAYNAELQQSPN